MKFRKRLTKEQQELIISNIKSVGLHGEINVDNIEVIKNIFPNLLTKEGEIKNVK